MIAADLPPSSRALRHARIHESLLKAEFDAEPDAAVVELAERIRSAPESAPRTGAPAAAATAAGGTADVGAVPKDARHDTAEPDGAAAAAEAVGSAAATDRDDTAEWNGVATASTGAR